MRREAWRTTDHRAGAGEQDRQPSSPTGERGHGAQHGHQQRAAGVAEFAAHLTAPMVCPSRLGSVCAASAANPSGVAIRRRSRWPTRRPAARAGRAAAPRSPGRRGQQQPGGHSRGVGEAGGVAGSPGDGCTSAQAAASRDTAIPVSKGFRPAAAPRSGRNPTPTASAAVVAARPRSG